MAVNAGWYGGSNGSKKKASEPRVVGCHTIAFVSAKLAKESECLICFSSGNVSGKIRSNHDYLVAKTKLWWCMIHVSSVHNNYDFWWIFNKQILFFIYFLFTKKWRDTRLARTTFTTYDWLGPTNGLRIDVCQCQTVIPTTTLKSSWRCCCRMQLIQLINGVGIFPMYDDDMCNMVCFGVW